MPGRNESEPGREAHRQEEIVETLIEGEQSGGIRLGFALAKPPPDGRPIPPETLHGKDQDVYRGGGERGDPEEDHAGMSAGSGDLAMNAIDGTVARVHPPSPSRGLAPEYDIPPHPIFILSLDTRHGPFPLTYLR